MDEAEFDKFADEYREIHRKNVRLSGEDPEFFAEYKIRELHRVISSTPNIGPHKILDFGAGTGVSVPYFKDYFPDSEITCLDVSEKSLDIGSSRYPDEARFVKFDGRSIPFADASYTIVFAACVFHHIEHSEHESLFSELLRILKPGGRIVIFEHNPLNPLTLHAVNTCEFDENAVLMRSGILSRRMSRAGFANPSVRFTLFFPHALAALRLFEPYLGWVPLGAQYYVSAIKSA